MDDLLLVRIMERVANSDEKLQAIVDVELMRIAVVIQRLPFDKLHDEIGQSVVSGATVHQTRNVRMVERGYYLTFGAKPSQDEIGVHAAFDELNRHAHVELFVYAHCFVDRAHSAASHFALNAVGAKAAT